MQRKSVTNLEFLRFESSASICLRHRKKCFPRNHPCWSRTFLAIKDTNRRSEMFRSTESKRCVDPTPLPPFPWLQCFVPAIASGSQWLSASIFVGAEKKSHIFGFLTFPSLHWLDQVRPSIPSSLPLGVLIAIGNMLKGQDNLHTACIITSFFEVKIGASRAGDVSSPSQTFPTGQAAVHLPFPCLPTQKIGAFLNGICRFHKKKLGLGLTTINWLWSTLSAVESL